MADERIQDPAVNVNEKIQDRTIRHMVFLERYKASEIRKVQRVLNNEIIPEITEKIERRLARILERGTDLGPVTTARLKDLEKELDRLAREMIDELKKTILEDLNDLTRDELDWQVRAIKESLGFDLEFIVPNPRSVAALIKRTSFAGLTLDQWFNSIRRSTQRNIMAAVQRGVVEGETTEQIIRRIRGTRRLNYSDGVWNSTRHQVEAVARTTINHTVSQSRNEFLKANEDIIKGVQWTSTLDSRTSTICAGLDGRVFPVDEGPRPPAHPNCRSTISPVLKSARQIGINKVPVGTRASVNGQVPASTTYGQWLRKQPIDVQEEVLGVTKAKLFRDGKLPIEKFTNSSLKPLTLDELRVLEKNAFDKAGITL